MADTATRAKAPDTLTPKGLVDAFIYATDWLGVYIDEVNALNVYPVPDGDTGTNMHLTMQSVRRQLLGERPRTMHEFAHALSYGSLLGARGNSGVILSQVLKGFAEVVRERKSLSAKDCVKALENASKTAYGAVMKPVEGTILTVVRQAAEASSKRESNNPLEVFKTALDAGREALAKTPDMLPILKQAGVVDAGGLGFLYVLEGVIASYEGKDLPTPPRITKRAQQQFAEEEFGFCTEFLLEGVTASTQDIQELVKPFGDSLLVVGAEGYVKGHIHTEEPEQLLATVARYGKMVRSKVEDMSEQHSEILADIAPHEAESSSVAMVVVGDGYGVTKVFRSLGARVVGGGQTNNPSVEDIADAVRSVGAETVIVLPNNKNIIMAAERADELVPDKVVRVLPTRSIGQGLAAAVVFDENADPSELYRQMLETSEHALTLEVTRATRNASVGDVAAEAGKPIGLIDGKLEVAADTPEDCLVQMLGSLTEEYEVATLFYNVEVGEGRAQELLERLEEAYPDLEIEVHSGAPDLYHYVMALE